MLSNRLWGGLQVAAGVVEMIGASTPCVLPEPTMAGKAGCVVFGVHGSDTAAAGLRQVLTGLNIATLTQQSATKLAETLKARPDIANQIGLSLDIAVPFGFASSIKAARAARITIGRINLHAHEAKMGSSIGGHTILKHVERTEAQLRERLQLEPRRQVVSSFASLERAEWAISEVISANTTRIQTWAKTAVRNSTLDLVKTVPGEIGYGITRSTGKLTSMNRVIVVLKYQVYNGMPY
ncbi:hypothetical protein GXB81_14795 [Paraburkholderia sp. Ac-20336]|nr:hypothetical protein [Paraburkholderia sp. Ac-20336]